MNSIKKFHQKNMKEVLNNQRQRNIKGGIRYFTNSQSDYQKKRTELSHQGILYDTHENDGIFCIEW